MDCFRIPEDLTEEAQLLCKTIVAILKKHGFDGDVGMEVFKSPKKFYTKDDYPDYNQTRDRVIVLVSFNWLWHPRNGLNRVFNYWSVHEDPEGLSAWNELLDYLKENGLDFGLQNDNTTTFYSKTI